MGMSTPSWRKVVASGMGTPRSSTAGAPRSPWTQEQDLSTRTPCPVIRSHCSVVGLSRGGRPRPGPLPGCRLHSPMTPARVSRGRLP